MQKFNPTAPARTMIEAGLVRVELRNSLYRNLAARADLDPGSQQLLAGGVGSGKTTELLLAESWLNSQGNMMGLYGDLTSVGDISDLGPGGVLAGFGILLLTAVPQLDQFYSEHLSHQELRGVHRAVDVIADFVFGPPQQNLWVDSGAGSRPK
ncbi:MAG: hypothetical protein AAB225_03260, partial [Acidobacteriota bacterium]